MYKDALWYTKLSRSIEVRKEKFTPKQISQYQIEFFLRLALRIKDYSDRSEACRDFQHVLTRLEAEMGELPASKAQRQYQREKLHEIAEYFVKHHRLAPPQYYTRKSLIYGLITGGVLGLIASLFIVSHSPLFLLGLALGGGGGYLYGVTEDNTIQREGRVI